MRLEKLLYEFVNFDWNNRSEISELIIIDENNELVLKATESLSLSLIINDEVYKSIKLLPMINLLDVEIFITSEQIIPPNINKKRLSFYDVLPIFTIYDDTISRKRQLIQTNKEKLIITENTLEEMSYKGWTIFTSSRLIIDKLKYQYVGVNLITWTTAWTTEFIYPSKYKKYTIYEFSKFIVEKLNIWKGYTTVLEDTIIGYLASYSFEVTVQMFIIPNEEYYQTLGYYKARIEYLCRDKEVSFDELNKIKEDLRIDEEEINWEYFKKHIGKLKWSDFKSKLYYLWWLENDNLKKLGKELNVDIQGLNKKEKQSYLRNVIGDI